MALPSNAQHITAAGTRLQSMDELAMFHLSTFLRPNQEVAVALEVNSRAKSPILKCKQWDGATIGLAILTAASPSSASQLFPVSVISSLSAPTNQHVVSTQRSLHLAMLMRVARI